jgi:transcriptional regulator with PAS, ATPase and Fis domain
MVSSTGILSSQTIDINLPPPEVIFGTTAAMQIVRLRLERAAGRNIPVLIRGESGTGKEVMARLLHHLSPWKHGPFVKVNCPAIPGTLMENELFGHERGAFTGAYSSKPGKIESAQAGTLFLDEIGDLETGLQAKLLQVLQDGCFYRIGGEAEQHIDVRIVSATNHNLEEDIASGSFREDLLYRLDGVTITLPPLRERKNDIPRIIDFLIKHHSESLNCMARPLSSSAMQAMLDYPWYGNIRELENVVRRYVIFGQEDAVLADLTRGNAPFFALSTSFDGDFSLKRITRQTVLELERRVIMQVLASNNWNRKKAARVLKISYRSLMYKIREMNIPPLRVKESQPTDSL